MRVLWVEDIPSGKEAIRTILDSYELTISKTYDTSLSKIKNANSDYDIILLDINLTGTTNTNTSASAKYLEGVKKGGVLIGRAAKFKSIITSADGFLKEAGFHLYIELIESGFPKDRIAFISANMDTVVKFSTIFGQARMLIPRSFESSEVSQAGMADPMGSPFVEVTDKSNLKTWLSDRDSDYVNLRRGIIDACNELRTGESIASRNLNQDLTDSENFIQDVEDNLTELCTMLPIVEPIDKDSLLYRVARVIVHDWDMYRERCVKTVDDKRPRRIKPKYGLVLKTARNILAHEKKGLPLTVKEQDLAFLFILHIRMIFKKIPDKYTKIEMKLLNLFENTDELDYKAVNLGIKFTYYTAHKANYYLKSTIQCKNSLCKKFRNSNRFLLLMSSLHIHLGHENSDKRNKNDNEETVSEAKKFAEYSESKNVIIENGMQVLYQGFFHCLCEPSSDLLNLSPPKPDGSPLVSFLGFSKIESISKEDKVLANAFYKSAGFPPVLQK